MDLCGPREVFEYMTNAPNHSDETVEVDENPNILRTIGSPNDSRLLTDGGEAESEDESTEDDADTESENVVEESEEETESDDEEEDEDADEADDEESEDEEEESEDDEESEEEEEEEEEEEDDEGTTVLYLDLEGLFLDLLGLEVDLEEVELDVSAVSGPGKLLGNLLDAVSGLLGDGGSGMISNLMGGSLFEGLMGDEDGDSLVDDLMGDDEEGEEGEEGEESESRLSSAFSSAKDSMGEAFEDIPLQEILTSVLKELITQMFSDSDDKKSDSESEA